MLPCKVAGFVSKAGFRQIGPDGVHLDRTRTLSRAPILSDGLTMSLEVLKAVSSRIFLYRSEARSIRTDDLTTRNSFLSGGTLKASCSVKIQELCRLQLEGVRSGRVSPGVQSLLHQVPPVSVSKLKCFFEPCCSASLSAV